MRRNLSAAEDGLDRTRFQRVYKEIDATHFPSTSGAYNKSAGLSTSELEPVWQLLCCRRLLTASISNARGAQTGEAGRRASP